MGSFSASTTQIGGRCHNTLDDLPTVRYYVNSNTGVGKSAAGVPMEKGLQVMIITIALLTEKNCHNATINLLLPTPVDIMLDITM